MHYLHAVGMTQVYIPACCCMLQVTGTVSQRTGADRSHGGEDLAVNVLQAQTDLDEDHHDSLLRQIFATLLFDPAVQIPFLCVQGGTCSA